MPPTKHVAAPKPPYENDKLHDPPLSHTERSRMVDWLTVWNKDTGKGPTRSDVAKLSDADLILIYATQVNDWHNTKGGVKNPSIVALENNPVSAGVTSVVDFLNKLLDPHLWVRIAEVIIGSILVAVGAAKLSGAANSLVKATPIGKVL